MDDLVFESVRDVGQEEFARLVRTRRLPGLPGRFELLQGRIVVTPPAGYPHGEIEAIWVSALRDARRGSSGRVFGSSQGFELPSGDTVEPDVSFVSAERWAKGPAPVSGEFLRVVPDLVVEILSPGRAPYDRGEKKRIYEQNGVGELWLVDSRARIATRFALTAAGRWDEGRAFRDGERLASTVLPGLTVEVAALFP
jgi:Uma2 family endonuclease